MAGMRLLPNENPTQDYWVIIEAACLIISEVSLSQLYISGATLAGFWLRVFSFLEKRGSIFSFFSYGADKHVDPANVLSLIRASNDSQSQWREQRRGNRYNKSDNLLPDLQTCV